MAYEVKAGKREWEGHETELQWGRYPVEHEPIRRHCHMIDDANPLFIEAGFIRACLCRVLTDWIGAEGFVRRLAFQMRTPNLVGETITARGRVTQKGPEGRVELEVWIENAGKGVTAPGSATVTLPSRR